MVFYNIVYCKLNKTLGEIEYKLGTVLRKKVIIMKHVSMYENKIEK